MQQNQVNMWLSMNAGNFRQQDLFFVKNTLEAMPDDCIMRLCENAKIDLWHNFV